MTYGVCYYRVISAEHRADCADAHVFIIFVLLGLISAQRVVLLLMLVSIQEYVWGKSATTVMGLGGLFIPGLRV